MAMQPHRRKGGRGQDYGRRDQPWGSPVSGSAGVNGSPRTGSPRSGRRRDPNPNPPPQSDHSVYVHFLRDLWHSVDREMTEGNDRVTVYLDKDFNPGIPEGPKFDIDEFFLHRNQDVPPRQSCLTSRETPTHHHPIGNQEGSATYHQAKPNT